jgi:NAD-dependent DNA ligase
MRPFMPFMYDGVVISYIEPDLIDALGRKNSVNQYSVAIKFNALKKQTMFLGYTYSVGQNGVITPMIHFNPVEFYGTIHTKSSGHSFKRFQELELRRGDIINTEFVNDVMIYVSKPDIEDNQNNPNPVEDFIEACPSCGNELTGSESGKSVICDNINCPGRNIARMVNMLQKLNLKDFSEETLRIMAKFSLTELLNLKVEDIRHIGETNSQKFIERMNQLKETPIYDYKIVGALGFSSVAAEKWKLILNQLRLSDVIIMTDDILKQTLVNIKGIGPVAAETICNEKEFFYQDLVTISNMKNIIPTKGLQSGKSIRFTGIRNSELSKKLNDMGHDANENAGVTKTTDVLIVPYDGYTSSKTSKVGENTIIVAHDEFVANMDKYL